MPTGQIMGGNGAACGEGGSTSSSATSAAVTNGDHVGAAGTNGEMHEPPLQKGEAVTFRLSTGIKTGIISRAYVMEDKYAIMEPGAKIEIRGANGAFLYFRRSELRRAVPRRPREPAADPGEPAVKHARFDGSTDENANGDSINACAAMESDDIQVEPAGPQRSEGRLKWFNKERGFGKIAPTVANGEPPAEEVFVHCKQVVGGPDGEHAQAMAEGVVVLYEVATGSWTGSQSAYNVEVASIARGKTPAPDLPLTGDRGKLLRRLLMSGMRVGTFQEMGIGKPSMEDRLLTRTGVEIDYCGELKRRAVCALFGVFDGHSGASCSDFLAHALDRCIFECLKHQGKREVCLEMAVRSALLAAFRTMEHNYFQYANKLDRGSAHAWVTAGSTAVTACFVGPDEEGRLRLVIANAGDSRAVLGKKDGRAVRLSEDHTPNVPSERKRIEKEGASVVDCHGIWRIVLASKKGTGIAGLSVSRGFGDFEYKQPSSVVSPVPDIAFMTVDLRKDSFIILGSDGVWGPVTDAEAVRIVAAALRSGTEEPAKRAAQQIVETAHQRDSSDDKTAVVVWFGDKPDAQMPEARAQAHVPHRRLVPPQVAGRVSGDIFTEEGQRAKQDMAEIDDLFANIARDMAHVAPRAAGNRR